MINVGTKCKLERLYYIVLAFLVDGWNNLNLKVCLDATVIFDLTNDYVRL